MKQLLFWYHERFLQQIISLTILFSITTLVVSCKNISSSTNVTQSVRISTSDSIINKPLRIAGIPWQNREEQQRKLQPLMDYLQKILNRPVSFQITKDYDTAVDLLVKEQVDMAYLAPLTYIKAHERNPNVEPLVLPIDQETGRPWYTSVIVANTNKGLKSLADLKGKRFSFVSPSSTSGFLLPMSAFQKNHIDPQRDFTGISYSGSHDKAEINLIAGRVDAIADDKASFVRSQKAGKFPINQYKIIWESSPLPSPPIVINQKKFSQEIINKLRQALIDAPVGVVDVGGTKSAGYTLGKDADFEEVRQIYLRFKSVKIAAK